MTTSLPKTIANRLKAGALVVILQEPDEQLARQAVELGAGPFGSLRYMSGSDQEALTALEELPASAGPGQVLVVTDLLSIYGSNPLTVRLVREVALQVRDPGNPYSRLVLLEHPSTQVPEVLLGDVEVLQPSLPTVEELREELEAFCQENGYAPAGGPEALYALSGAVAGLARHEASRLFARCFVERGTLDPAWLRTEKAQKVATKLGGALTFESPLSAPVGGLENLKDWLGARKAAFGSQDAKAFGLPEPKGMLLLGIPGCGKSLTAKTVAREWGLPLLRLDVGKVFGSLVGQSEAQVRAAIEAAEACAPCVMWVDEIEKGLAGSGSDGSSDSGTSQRVFGTLLTWLQEKESPVFVVATANKISNLPPELLRKGRFDEIFFVGLPSTEEREAISRIHLERRGRQAEFAGEVASLTEGFSGAEIEQAVIEGLFTAYSCGRDLLFEDVASAVKATTPISKTMGVEIEALRKWADGRARPASAEKSKTKTKAPRRRGPALSK